MRPKFLLIPLGSNWKPPRRNRLARKQGIDPCKGLSIAEQGNRPVPRYGFRTEPLSEKLCNDNQLLMARARDQFYKLLFVDCARHHDVANDEYRCARDIENLCQVPVLLKLLINLGTL